MNWDDLRILAAVHNQGTFAAAGKHVGLDETTVGRRIARLEKLLAAKLLDASDGRRRLTANARELMVHLQAMTRHADEIFGVASSISKSGAVGRVRLATTNALAEEVLAPRMPKFLLGNPGLTLELQTSTHTVNFSRWEADLAVRLQKPRRGEYAISKLATIPLFLLEPVDSSADTLVCCYPDDHAETVESRYLLARGLQDTGRCITASGRAIRAMIVSGQSVGILPEYLCRDLRLDPTLRVTELPQRREVWLLIQPHLKRDRATRSVIDWLKSCFPLHSC